MKPFRVLIIGAAVWGITLALAFVVGIAVGSSGDDEVTQAAAFVQPTGPGGQQGELDPAEREQLRERIRSGEATQEDLDRIQQRFQQGGGGRGQFGGLGTGGPGPGGGQRSN